MRLLQILPANMRKVRPNIKKHTLSQKVLNTAPFTYQPGN